MKPSAQTVQAMHHHLRKLRLWKGYSQEYMGHRLGISQRAYSKLERGETRLTIERWLKLRQILEVDRIDH